MGWTGLAAALAVAFLSVAMGPRWFSLYGAAAIVLVLVPFVWRALADQLRANGRSRAWALLVVVPTVLLALGQIGFWVAFYQSPQWAVILGPAREMIGGAVTPALPYFGIAVLVLAGAVVRALTVPRPAASRPAPRQPQSRG